MSTTISRRSVAPGQTRAVLRAVHLVLGTVAGFAVYAPVPDRVGRQLLALVVFPGLTVTGMWIWQQAKVRRLVRRWRAAPEGSG